MPLKTALYQEHVALSAKMVDFAGWQMPLHYGSQIDEHMAVRAQAGIFDVSHMLITDLTGPDIVKYLRYLLANDIARMKAPGKALYSCMLNEQGGVVDDCIIYGVAEGHYRMVSNAATRKADLNWMRQNAAAFEVTISENTNQSIIACQGAQTRAWAPSILPGTLNRSFESMKPFSVAVDGNYVLASTGYTGEAGFELMLPNTEAVAFWQRALAVGFKPVGLAARDTLRLEAGLNLYGADMDASTSPLISNLAWTVSWHDATRDFIGKAALLREQQAGVHQALIGLILQTPGVLRAHQAVYAGDVRVGQTTSGTYSPYLKKSIALARVKYTKNAALSVLVRAKHLPVIAVKPCFVRQGKPQIQTLDTLEPTLKEKNHE